MPSARFAAAARRPAAPASARRRGGAATRRASGAGRQRDRARARVSRRVRRHREQAGARDGPPPRMLATRRSGAGERVVDQRARRSACPDLRCCSCSPARRSGSAGCCRSSSCRKVSNGMKPLGHFQVCVHGHSSASYQYFLRIVGQAWLPMKVMIDDAVAVVDRALPRDVVAVVRVGLDLVDQVGLVLRATSPAPAPG